MTDPTARIEAALSDLGSEHEPPAGWEKRVIAATSTRSPTRWWPYWTSALALGCAILALRFIGPGHDGKPAELGITVSSERPKNAVATLADPTHERSPELGDVLRVEARGGPYRALWLYRENRLVAACPGSGSCEYTRDATIARFTVDALGEYRAIALAWSAPLPPPRGTLEVDVVNARAAGANITEQPVPVH